MRAVRVHERQEESTKTRREVEDRVGHVYYCSLRDELVLVVNGTDMIFGTQMTWQCISLEESRRPMWHTDYDIDNQMSRVA